MQKGSGGGDVDYICVGAELLGRMLAELEALKSNNHRLTLAMAAAGHDLRQRLHTLLGIIELLTAYRDANGTAELGHRAKALILRLAGELEELARQAKTDSTCVAHSSCRFGIAPILQQIESDWQAEATAKNLSFAVDHPDCSVESDRRLLAAIMDNLVGNAVRHTSEGSVRVESMKEGGFLVLAVTDTGPGISDDDLRRSFGFSPRLGTAGKGMGLGLSIARSAAKMLGHDLHISTAPNSGTRVRLQVPLSAD
jgi:signal transduction histidine kinase